MLQSERFDVKRPIDYHRAEVEGIEPIPARNKRLIRPRVAPATIDLQIKPAHQQIDGVRVVLLCYSIAVVGDAGSGRLEWSFHLFHTSPKGDDDGHKPTQKIIESQEYSCLSKR